MRSLRTNVGSLNCYKRESLKEIKNLLSVFLLHVCVHNELVPPPFQTQADPRWVRLMARCEHGRHITMTAGETAIWFPQTTPRASGGTAAGTTWHTDRFRTSHTRSQTPRHHLRQRPRVMLRSLLIKLYVYCYYCVFLN